LHQLNFHGPGKGIRRLQRELKTSVSEFPQFGLIGRITPTEKEQNLLGQSYTETQNELQEQEDPFITQREPDLTKEQEEYFRRIR
jgi:hypothetical protein